MFDEQVRADTLRQIRSMIERDNDEKRAAYTAQALRYQAWVKWWSAQDKTPREDILPRPVPPVLRVVAEQEGFPPFLIGDGERLPDLLAEQTNVSVVVEVYWQHGATINGQWIYPCGQRDNAPVGHKASKGDIVVVKRMVPVFLGNQVPMYVQE